MKKPRICAVIVNNDLKTVKAVEPSVDLFEVRIDLIGDGWQALATQLERPWIACNRSAREGGRWRENESKRMREILDAAEMNADIVDIELQTKGLKEVISHIKTDIKTKTKCLVSFHDLTGTPPQFEMQEIVSKQIEAGADICKVVTTANKFEDNLTVLQLISGYPKKKIVAFAMGPLGTASRILCPLVGGDFTYASIKEEMASASGQITVRELEKLYGILDYGK